MTDQTTPHEIHPAVNRQTMTQAWEIWKDWYSTPGVLMIPAGSAFNAGWQFALATLSRLTEEEKLAFLKDAYKQLNYETTEQTDEVSLRAMDNLLASISDGNSPDDIIKTQENVTSNGSSTRDICTDITITFERDGENVTFNGSSTQLVAIQAWLNGALYRCPKIGTRDICVNATITFERDGEQKSITINRGDIITQNYEGNVTVNQKEEAEPQEQEKKVTEVTFNGSTSQLLAIRNWIQSDNDYRAPGISTRDILVDATIPTFHVGRRILSEPIERGDIIHKLDKFHAHIERPNDKYKTNTK